jgi:hypothetical protein
VPNCGSLHHEDAHVLEVGRELVAVLHADPIATERALRKRAQPLTGRSRRNSFGIAISSAALGYTPSASITCPYFTPCRSAYNLLLIHVMASQKSPK